MEPGSNYYALLDLLPDASPDEIRRAYHEAARRLHPDVSESPNAIEIFLEVQKAYEVLTDPQKRTAYDSSFPPETFEHLKRYSAELTSPHLHFGVQYSRTQLSKIETEQLLYVLMELSPIAPKGTNTAPPLNVCLVLDRSTSMQGERMDTVKATAIELMRQMRPEDILSIVVFGDRSEILLPALKHTDREEAATRIRMLRPGGGTEIFRGLESAYMEVHRNLTNKRINHIILITDGRTYGDENDCLNVAQAASGRGIRISSLGIGEEWNDEFLDKLAARTGGHTVYVSQAGDLKDFLQGIFRDYGNIFGEQASLDIKLAEGVRLGYIYRLQPDSAPLALELPVKLGSLPANGKLSLLAEFTIGPLSKRAYQLPILSGSLQIQLPALDEPTQTLPVNLSRPVNNVGKPELPPTDIVQALSYITLYRMQEQAIQEVSEGNYAAAGQHLQKLATQLFARGENDLAQTALMEAERIRHTQSLSLEGAKQIKYGTRSLLLPPLVRYGKT